MRKWYESLDFFVEKNQSRAGQGPGHQNSSRAGYRLPKYLNLQSSTEHLGHPLATPLHSDQCHNFIWILNIYSLHAYALLKIIQIYLKISKELTQSRTFIEYLSSIEERILS
jgi:hypothetical protein